MDLKNTTAVVFLFLFKQWCVTRVFADNGNFSEIRYLHKAKTLDITSHRTNVVSVITGVM